MRKIHPLDRSHPQGIFITGTDTNVGKTVITAALGLALQKQKLRLGVMKPIETGITPPKDGPISDGSRLHGLFAIQNSVDMVTPYQFPDPLAPLAASRRGQQSIDFDFLKNCYQKVSRNCDILLVEGAGGVMVPLSEQQTIRDLIAALQLPCIVVSKPTLGGVNHTLLTLEALRDRQIKVLAIVLNHSSAPTTSETDQLQIESTIQLIRELGGVPVFGPLDFEPLVKNDWVQAVSKMASDSAITQLVQKLLGKD